MKIANYQIENYIQRINNEKIAGCLVYGPESSVVRYRFSVIAKKIVKDLADPFLVVNIDEDKIKEDSGILADEFFAFPMFGGRKLIIIKDAGSYTAQSLKALIANKDFANKSDNFILIQGEDLSKSSALRKIVEDNPSLASIACYEDDEQVVRKFISEKLQENQLKFNLKIIDLLLEKFGKNRQLLNLEIEKIAQYFHDDKNLNLEDLSLILVDQNEISANQFVANFADKKYAIALNQLNKMLDGDFEAIALVRILSGYFQKLYNAKLMIERDGKDFDMAVKAQFLFFKIEAEFRRHLKNLSLNSLVKILGDLEKIEIKIKSTKMPPKLIFLSYIRDLAL
jgi:DNA polymerase-3 subunit delta